MNTTALMSSDRMDWNTPQCVVDLLNAAWPGVDLDPCSNENSIVNARKVFTIDDDGLAQPWDVPDDGLIYVNPPYGRALGDWAKKIDSEHTFRRSIVTLVPARVDTKWWHTLVKSACYVVFLRGRLRFLGAPAGAPFPSALIVHGSLRPVGVNKFIREAVTRGAWVVNARTVSVPAPRTLYEVFAEESNNG